MERLDDSCKSRFALFISCRKLPDTDTLSKTDSQVYFYLYNKDMEEWGLVSKTDVVMNNLNPDYSTYIETNYYFERKQEARFEVYDIDTLSRELIGTTETSLGVMIASTN